MPPRRRPPARSVESTQHTSRLSRLLRILGPGFITGAADDDPSGIATHSQTGAQFGYGQLWTIPALYPLMTAVQEACARIGAVTGKGIVANVRDHYPRPVLYLTVALVVTANAINIGADLGAMGAAANLLVPVPALWLTVVFTVVMVLLEVFISYRRYAGLLKWLSLSLLAYLATALIVQQPWDELVSATFIPRFQWTAEYLFVLTGVLGTTISPYMFFWEASEEVEEEEEEGGIDAAGHPHVTPEFIRNLRLDNALGMLASQIAAWSIIVVGASVLHANGVTDIRTAADAAMALEPLVQSFPNAGTLAKGIFALGVVGLGLLAVPVLAGSAAYALGEAFRFRTGLSLTLREGGGFYGVIVLAMLVGLGMNLLGLDPVKALIYAAVLNGLAAVPLLFIIQRLASDRGVMGAYASGRLSRVLLWITFAGMGTSAVAMVWTAMAGS